MRYLPVRDGINQISRSEDNIMKAGSKEHFVQSWNDVPNQLTGLMNSAETTKTFAKIERLREELKTLILEVANEAYPEQQIIDDKEQDKCFTQL